MKIMMVETSGHGKLCQYTYSLCTVLAQFGGDVTLITSKEYELDGLPADFTVLKIFPEGNMLIYPFYFFRFIYHLKRLEPDVLHFQWFPSPILGLIFLKVLKMFTDARIVYTPHNILPHRRRFYFVGAWAGIYKEVDKIIAHSRYNRTVISDLFEIDPERVSIIPDFLFFNHITGDFDKEDSRKALSLPVEGRLVLFFGYINRRKGIEPLIRSFKEVRASIPDARLVIAGQPNENFTPYIRLIEGLGLKEEVILDLRYIPFKDMMRYFASADLVVLPYQKVCHSPIVQLARSFNRPVVTTELANRDDVDPGSVVDPFRIDQLTKAIIDVLRGDSDPYNGLDNGEDRWKDIASRMFDVYSL